MKKIIFILLIINCSLLIAEAQVKQISVVQQKWVARYNGPGNGTDQATSIAVDGSGNVYVIGQSPGSGTGLDYVTIKYNSLGVQQWVQRYNGPGNSHDYVTIMVLDGSGNVYITGGSWGSGTSFDVATIKYNSSGVQQWIHRYNGINNGNDIASGIVLDAQGNVYITGYTNYIYDDFLTIKYNSSGVLQWAQTYNNFEVFGDDYGYALALDPSGNVYTTGYSQGMGGGFDFATVKYNSSGVEQWVQKYIGSTGLDDFAVSITPDGSGNVVITGSSSDQSTAYDYTTIKYTSEGVQQWLQKYNGPLNGGEFATKIILDGSGNLIVTGNSYGSNGVPDYATVKYNSAGVQQWAARYNGPSNNYDAASLVVADASGNVYVTGESNGSGTSRDYATIKYNSSGVQHWVQRYNGPGNSNDIARSIAADNLGNIYVTGESTGSGSGLDFATIKYSQSNRPIANEITEIFKLSENFPNPFNPTTVISYNLAVSSFASLKIYDVLGNEIASLVNERQNAGTYSVEWNASNFPSGVYFYKLVTEEFIETKKMTLIK